MLQNLLAQKGQNIWFEVQGALKELIDSMWLPLIAIMGALGVIFGVLIGWSFWQAGGDEAKIKEAKGKVKNYIIGWFVIFILAVATPLLVTALSTWFDMNSMV